MKRFVPMLAIAVFGLSTACWAQADKKVSAEPEEMIDVPAQVAQASYAYLENFPAKQVVPLLKSLEEILAPQLKDKKETVKMPKAAAKAVYDALMKEQTVQLTIALQQAMNPAPAVAPAPAPAKEEKK